MIALVLAALGQLAELLTRLTTTRAGNLDKLDANITSRAASSTALSNAVWTDAKAAFLDVSIASRAKANVQTGYVSTSSTSVGTGEDARYLDVTITAVSSVAKCDVRFEGGSLGTTGAGSISPMATAADGGTSNIAFSCTARLTSTTNLRISSPDGAATIRGRWKVLDLGAA